MIPVVVEPLFSFESSFFALRFPKSPPKPSIRNAITKEHPHLPAGAAAVPVLAASVSLDPNSDGPGAALVVDDDAGAPDSSGLFPNRLPLEIFPAGAVFPDEEFSADLGTEPKNPPPRVGVLVPDCQRSREHNVLTRTFTYQSPLQTNLRGVLRKLVKFRVR